MHESLGFAHFLAQADAVAKFILALLVLMSAASWYLILTKAVAYALVRRHSRRFLERFWTAESLAAVEEGLRQAGAHDPFSRLVQQGLAACDQYRRRDQARLIETGSADEFLTRALRRVIERETARAESGLTFLASVGSSAPFIGLFGTVWGIYHALLAIGLSGQGTLDKVAGPVGEALIMTALGLAVAIPAVLAYNAFTRANRVLLSELDGFAHDVFAFMVTGVRAADARGRSPTEARPAVRPVAAAQGGG
ncbi:MotA/TolQ/ExbB proton channel family protein [Pelomicrobium sp. G1]|uniref:MotA/TolQ/ExbB proton channel family protein n=1 Tax=unclassified Pelomicrobium TaxID=2815318 RepID=UPI003F766D3D